MKYTKQDAINRVLVARTSSLVEDQVTEQYLITLKKHIEQWGDFVTDALIEYQRKMEINNISTNKMAGCGKKIEVWIVRGFIGKEITVKCGSTSPHGSPWLCEKCEEIHAGTDWRYEAEMNGEQWDEDY